MKVHRIYFTIVLLLIIFGCGGPKSLTRKGEKLANKGMHREACDYFVRALEAKSTLVDAQIGLKMSGQKIIDEFASLFFKSFSTGEKKSAVYAYIDMKRFYERAKGVGVELSMASHYEDDFNQVKADYLDERFVLANQKLNNEDFLGAETIFNEIIQLQPDYKDVASLKKFAHIEPIYRKGVEAMKKEKYRSAYYSFNSVFKQQEDYKDALQLMNECLKEAQYTIVIMAFENVSNDRSASDKIAAKTLNDILENKGPFIRVIDRQNLNVLLQEQKLGMEGILDESTAVNAGHLIGAKAVLVGKVLDVKVMDIPVRYAQKQGYESYKVRKLDAKTQTYYNETNYKKVYYYEYNGSRSVSCSFQYKLISAETGEILLSDIKTVSDYSQERYATYNGNVSNLYPGRWESYSENKPTDQVYNGYSEQNELHQLIKSPQHMRGKEEMLNDIYTKIGSSTAKEIFNYNPETSK